MKLVLGVLKSNSAVMMRVRSFTKLHHFVLICQKHDHQEQFLWFVSWHKNVCEVHRKSLFRRNYLLYNLVQVFCLSFPLSVFQSKNSFYSQWSRVYFSITLIFAQTGLHLINYLSDSESNDSATTGYLGHSPSLVLLRISLVKLVHFTNEIRVK